MKNGLKFFSSLRLVIILFYFNSLVWSQGGAYPLADFDLTGHSFSENLLNK
jgi:ABC-type glucose/galactose transport system permease subunit